MAKTTKRARPVRSLQKFNQGDTVNSVTLAGATGLADLDITPQGDLTITLKRDTTKADKSTIDELIKNILARLEALEQKGN